MEGMNKVKAIAKGVLLGYIITIISLIIYSAILAYTNVSEKSIPLVLFIIGLASVFIASSLTVIKIKKSGLKNGGLIGLCYVMILYVLSSFYGVGFSLTKYSILTIILYIFLGMFGGIVGVNLLKQN